jgi:cobalt/nickel transport system permease protein
VGPGRDLRYGGLNYSALLPDYSVTGLPDVAGYIISAIVGVAILVIVFKLLGLRGSGGPAEVK